MKGPGRPRGKACLGLLRKAVEKAGSPARLAKALGMTRQAVSTWTTEKCGLSPESHVKLQNYIEEREGHAL